MLILSHSLIFLVDKSEYIGFTENKLSLMKGSNGLCKLCNSNRQTIYNLFWECRKMKPIWEYAQELLNKYILMMHATNLAKLSYYYQDVRCRFSHNTIVLSRRHWLNALSVMERFTIYHSLSGPETISHHLELSCCNGSQPIVVILGKIMPNSWQKQEGKGSYY